MAVMRFGVRRFIAALDGRIHSPAENARRGRGILWIGRSPVAARLDARVQRSLSFSAAFVRRGCPKGPRAR